MLSFFCSSSSVFQLSELLGHFLTLLNHCLELSIRRLQIIIRSKVEVPLLLGMSPARMDLVVQLVIELGSESKSLKKKETTISFETVWI